MLVQLSGKEAQKLDFVTYTEIPRSEIFTKKYFLLQVYVVSLVAANFDPVRLSWEDVSWNNMVQERKASFHK